MDGRALELGTGVYCTGYVESIVTWQVNTSARDDQLQARHCLCHVAEYDTWDRSAAPMTAHGIIP